MQNWLNILREGANELGLTISGNEEALFSHFLQLLLERNQHVNLTAITDPVEIAAKHFVDSLSVEMLWHPQAGDVALDIGTGAGVPGIPLAIRHPQVKIILNDSARKKVDFLRDVAEALPLANVVPAWARAEALGRDPHYRARCNTVFARAVAHLSILSEYALPLLKVGGSLIAMKGPSGETEVMESARALQLIGGKVTTLRRLTIAGAGDRLLIEVTKTKKTPEQFPREAKTMKNKPLYLDSSNVTP